MKPRVLLVNPWIHDFAAYNLWAYPLGLLAVAEYLSGFDADLFFVDCLDSYQPGRYGSGKYRFEIIQKPEVLKNVPRRYKRYGIPHDAFRAFIRSRGPFDAVLISSAMSYWYPGIQETIAEIRQVFGQVPVVLGGIYPTLFPEHASRFSGADSIFRGPVNERLALVFQDLGIVLNPREGHVPHYAQDLHPRRTFAPLLTSTGCPYRCSYCASHLLSPSYRPRPVDDILLEVSYLQGKGVRDFAFYDDALLYRSGDHIKPLLRAILHNDIPARFHAPNGLHARFMDGELAHLMKASGFVTVRLSLETIDPGRQQQSGGKLVTADFGQSVMRLKQAGFRKEHLGAYLLYGLPGQELGEVEEGIAYLKDLGVRIHLAEFSPIRGTACWDELVRNNIIPDDLDPLLTNNTVYSFLYSGYEQKAVERVKLDVKDYNALE